MAVITNQTESEMRAVGPEARCNFCGGFLQFPFVTWTERYPVHLCHRCCDHLGKGLMADIVQVRAIKDLHRLGYSDFTLERVHMKPNAATLVEIDMGSKRRSP